MGMNVRDYIPRHVEPRIRKAMNQTHLVIIQGLPKSGKTTLARKMAAELGMRFFDLFDENLRIQVQNHPRDFIKSLPRSGAVIDGMQHVPELAPVLKESLRKTKSPGKFLITVTLGQLSIDNLVADVLPIKLNPLTQGELHGLKTPSDVLDVAFAAKFTHGEVWEVLGDLWFTTIKGGYFDSVFAVDPKTRTKFFRGYVNDLDLEDLLVKEGIESSKSTNMKKLFEKIAKSSGGLVSHESRGKRLGEKNESIEIWLTMLMRIGVLHLVKNYDKRKDNPLRKKLKCYASDTGLISFFHEWKDSTYVALRAEKGMLLESLVFIELIALIDAFPQYQTRLYYYRNASDIEVDFVLTRGKSVVAIEVKSASEVHQKDLRGLRHLRDEVGADFVCGVLFYTGNTVKRLGDRLYAVPVSRLWNVAKR